MKKSLALLLAGVLLALSACGTAADAPAPSPGTQSASPAPSATAQTDGASVTAGFTAEPDPDSSDLVSVLYVPNADADGFDLVEVDHAGTAQALLDALIAHGAVPDGTTVLSYQMGAGEDGDMTGTLDLSKPFLDAVTSTGTAGETALLWSVADTFIKQYELKSITITSEGKTIETGHAVYDAPLTFLDQY